MPKYIVTDNVTGLKLELEGDSPPNEQELQSIFENARKNSQGSNSQPEPSNQSLSAANLDEIGSAPELDNFSMAAFKASIGLMTTGDDKSLRGIIKSQIPSADFLTDESGNTIVKFPSGNYALNKPGFSGQDLARGIFQFGGFTPAGVLSAVPKAAASRLGTAAATSGATDIAMQQGAKSLGGSEIDLSQAALSAGLGVAGQGVGEALSGAAGLALKNKSQAAKKSSEIIAAGEEAGVPVLTSDLSPPKNIVSALARQVGERIPIFGTGGVRAGQQEARENAALKFSESFEPFSHSDIINSLASKKDKIKSAVGARLNKLSSELDTKGNVPLANLNDAIQKASQRLKSAKIGLDSKTIKEIDSISNGASQPHTFSELRSSRTAIREIAEATDALGKSQLPTKSKAAIKSIEMAATKDLDDYVLKNLGENALIKYKKADEVYRDEAIKMSKSRIKNILDKGSLTPEVIESMLFSRKPSEVKMLYSSLSSPGRSAARSALIQRAVKAASVDDVVNPTILANKLNSIRDNTKVFFNGEDLRQLRGLENLLTATKRAQEASVVTPTGQSLLFLTGAGAGSQVGILPSLVAATTGGAAARIYESKPVRNMLIKLSNIEMKDTKLKNVLSNSKVNKILKDSAPEINALIQSINGAE